jgi:hypothetical protein
MELSFYYDLLTLLRLLRCHAGEAGRSPLERQAVVGGGEQSRFGGLRHSWCV